MVNYSLDFELMSDDQQDAFRELERWQAIEDERKSRWTADHHPFGDEYDVLIDVCGDSMWVENRVTGQSALCTPVMQVVYLSMLLMEVILGDSANHTEKEVDRAIVVYEAGREWFARFHGDAHITLID